MPLPLECSRPIIADECQDVYTVKKEEEIECGH